MKKVVLITGGSEGIGRACAEHFSKMGDQVVIVGRRADVLKQTADQIDNCTPLVGDMTNSEDVKRVFREATKNGDHVSLVIHTAGAFDARPFNQLNSGDLDAFVAPELEMLFSIAWEANEIAKSRGSAMLIVANSRAGLREEVLERSVLYATTKNAITGMCVALDKDCPDLRVRTCSFGGVDTRMGRQALADRGITDDRFLLKPAIAARGIAFIAQQGSKSDPVVWRHTLEENGGQIVESLAPVTHPGWHSADSIKTAE